MEKLTRRTFIETSLGSLLTFSLLKSLCRAQALTGSVQPVAHKWLIEMEQVTRSLRHAKIKQTEWQQQFESILARVDLNDLLKAIDYDRLAKIAVFPEDHESAEDVDFSKLAGLPGELSFNPYFYAMENGVAIVPHAHNNMTSMHMVLKGKSSCWQYDRISDDSTHLIIKPTADTLLVPGNISTVSDDRNNIHWFKAIDGLVFMFNIGVFAVRPNESFTGRDYIDPRNGERINGGLIRARRIEKLEAYKLYGRT